MRSIEFMYWLQGAFEVCDLNELNKEQSDIIRKHLEMVKLHDENSIHNFCTWLDGFCEALNWEINKDNTLKIKNKLNDFFEHVVEHKLTQKNELPYDSHNGQKLNPTSESVLIRC